MGYITCFNIEATSKDPAALDAVNSKALEELEASTVITDKLIIYGDGKWYDYETDLAEISERFPDLKIYVQGTGGNSGDIWATWITGGEVVKHQAAEPFKPIPPEDWDA